MTPQPDLQPDSLRTERARQAMWGLLVGDATGVPFEGSPPEALPALNAIDIDPPPMALGRLHESAPARAWSDDGAQALCLLECLLEDRQLDLDAFGKRLLAWRDNGLWAVDGHVFSVGLATRAALDRLARGVASADSSGGTEASSNGNGSLMRVLPIALTHQDGEDLDALLVRAARSSLVTHAHPVSLLCCAWYCVVAYRLLSGVDWDAAWDEARERAHDFAVSRGWRGHWQSIVDGELAAPRGLGHVVSTLWSAKESVEKSFNYRLAIQRAIAFGHDTDTTAAVAGGLAAMLWPVHPEWLAKLAGREQAATLIDRLVVYWPTSQPIEPPSTAERA